MQVLIGMAVCRSHFVLYALGSLLAENLPWHSWAGVPVPAVAPSLWRPCQQGHSTSSSPAGSGQMDSSQQHTVEGQEVPSTN